MKINRKRRKTREMNVHRDLATLLGCLNVDGVLRPKTPKERKHTSTKVCSWSISDVKIKAQEARFWPWRHKSSDYLKGPKSMQRRDEGRSFGKPPCSSPQQHSFPQDQTELGMGDGVIANDEASNPGRLPREHVVPIVFRRSIRRD
jgi:hypothetical protein